jgi:hypothetical protein
MALKDVLQQFLKDMEWKEEIEHSDQEDADFISTNYEIDGQSYRVILATHENGQILRVFFYSPIKIPKARAKEAAFVFNFLNAAMSAGNLEMNDDGAVYYRWAIAVKGTTAAPEQFHTLLGYAEGAFVEATVAAIGAAAFSKQSAEDIVEDFKAAAKKLTEQSDEAPASL